MTIHYVKCRTKYTAVTVTDNKTDLEHRADCPNITYKSCPSPLPPNQLPKLVAEKLDSQNTSKCGWLAGYSSASHKLGFKR